MAEQQAVRGAKPRMKVETANNAAASQASSAPAAASFSWEPDAPKRPAQASAPAPRVAQTPRTQVSAQPSSQGGEPAPAATPRPARAVTTRVAEPEPATQSSAEPRPAWQSQPAQHTPAHAPSAQHAPAQGPVAQAAPAQGSATQSAPAQGPASQAAAEQSAPDSGPTKVRRSFTAWVRHTFPGHEHAFYGGLVALVLALLVFAIGFLRVLFICLLVAAGVALGQVLDGDAKIIRTVRELLSNERGQR